jgi:hypothetical protein
MYYPQVNFSFKDKTKNKLPEGKEKTLNNLLENKID